MKDYYQVLGVDESADKKAIKAAYRKLARKYHPDINSEADAEEKFKEVAEAYEVLGNKEKRAEYDQLRKHGAAGSHQGFGQGHADQGGFRYHYESGGGAEHDFSDFFEQFFSKGESYHRPSKGQDIEAELPLFLEDVFRDSPKQFTLNMPYRSQDGRVSQHPKTIQVRLPKGVADGDRIRLKGQGGELEGASERGDLYLTIRFAPHPNIDVKGHDLEMVVPVYPFEAALGGKISIETLDGDVELTLPESTPSGKKLRLKEKGLPTRTGRGNLYVLIDVVMPKVLTAEQKRLWAELAATVKERLETPRRAAS